MKVSPPLKWHGGKYYLASRIVALMPPHVHYVEPFAGGLAVLLARDPLEQRLWVPPNTGVSEVVNDLDRDLMSFWAVLADPASFLEFQRLVEATPFSQVCWNSARFHQQSGISLSLVQRAWVFFVQCRQSLAGRRDTFAPLSRTRTRRGMNEQASAWLTAVEGLPEVHSRLRSVVVLDGPALDVIRSQDGPDTLFYLDPPYLAQTRSAPEVYRHEMTEEQHRELLSVVVHKQGKFMISGYRSELYDQVLSRWTRHDFDLPNNAAGGKGKRRMTESLWCNW